MTKEQMSSNLELYSNAIVGFMVIQSLAFCYQFGNPEFNRIVRTHRALLVFLSAMFALSCVMGLFATEFISRRLQRMNEEYSSLVKSVYRFKQVAIGLFSVLLIVVSLSGVFGGPPANPVAPARNNAACGNK